MTTDRTVLLRRGGCSVLIAAGPAQPWCVVHWGSDLGDLDDQAQTAVVAVTARPVPPSSLDRAVRVGLVPEAARGWTGRPGLSGHPARRRRRRRRRCCVRPAATSHSTPRRPPATCTAATTSSRCG